MKNIVLIISLVFILSNFSPVVKASSISDITPSGIPISELEQFVNNYAAEYIGTTTAGASIVVLKDGEIVFGKAYGYADIENAVEVDADTIFEWGSDTKLLTWTSVMQLVERGKLDLNTDICEYLPEGFLTKLKFNTPVTLYNLMHHNAGWEDRYTDLFYRSADDLVSLEETLRIFEPNQVNEPGTVVAYSNYGTALAGYIVEYVSGQPFYEYVNEHIFAVLGMNDTAIHPAQADNSFVAAKREIIHGYKLTAGGKLVKSPTERIFIGLYPAGSAMGTAEDAAKFIAALIPSEGETSPLFQRNDTLDEMLSTSYSYSGDFPGIAHGFWENYNAVKTLGHGGNTDSFSSYFSIAPDADMEIVVMTNQANETGLCAGLTNALLGDYAIEYEEELPDAHELEGSYIMARRAYSGFTKIMGFLNIGNVKAIDGNTIELLGAKFTQVSPYIYRNDGGGDTFDTANFLHFTVEDGKVVRASILYGDFLPLPEYVNSILILNSVLAAVCTLFIITAVFIIIIGGIRNKKKGLPSSPVKKFNMRLNIAGVAALTNNIVLVTRALQYSAYAPLRLHFAINLAYMGFALTSIIFMIVKSKKSELTKGQKLFYTLSCIIAIIFIGLMIGWELYR